MKVADSPIPADISRRTSSLGYAHPRQFPFTRLLHPGAVAPRVHG